MDNDRAICLGTVIDKVLFCIVFRFAFLIYGKTELINRLELPIISAILAVVKCISFLSI